MPTPEDNRSNADIAISTIRDSYLSVKQEIGSVHDNVTSMRNEVARIITSVETINSTLLGNLEGAEGLLPRVKNTESRIALIEESNRWIWRSIILTMLGVIGSLITAWLRLSV